MIGLWLGFSLLAAFVMLSLIGCERQRRLDDRHRVVEITPETPEEAPRPDHHNG